MAIERKISPTHEAPYRGLRVLDFGQGIASPYCAMLLGVYGADVIKVEPPEGDWSRFLGTTYGSHTTLSAVYNRGKRSLCLDMKHKDGIAIARRLAKDCDVLIEGFRPGVAARLGIGYEELSRDNPGLIYLSVSAFGQSGPYSKRPGSDSVAQAFSGLVSINVGNDGTPHRVGTTISDVVTGVYAFQAIATTLFARATVGTGRWIDVNLCQSTSALLGHKVAEHILEGGAPRALNVPAGSYQTADGWMMVTLVNEPQYKRLCAAIGRDDLASDPRFADFARRADAVDALIPQLREVFLTQPTDVWLARLHAADLIAERILNPGEWLRNVHVEATRAAVCQQTPGVGPVYSPRTPGIASFSEDDLRPAPDIGQDSYEVLLEAGFERGAIDDLVKAGAVRQAKKGRHGMSTDLVRYSVSGNIAEIMLDRPPVNALSMDLIDALLAALSKARDDEAVRAVIIGSAHKVFCAGLDLDIVRGKPRDRDQEIPRTAVFRAQRYPVSHGQADHRCRRRRGAGRRHDDCDLLRHDHRRRRLYLRLSRDRCRPDPGDSLRAIAAAGRQAPGVWTAVSGRALRCRDRLSHGAAERGGAEGDRA